MTFAALCAVAGCSDLAVVSDEGMRHALAAVGDVDVQPVAVPRAERALDAATAEPPAGYVRAKPLQRSGDFGNAVLLVTPGEEKIVPIFIGGTEALSIQLRIQGQKFTRPLTHDLFDAFATKIGAKMLRAQVDTLTDGVYLGSVVFERPGADGKPELLRFDARPSDAIALAIGNAVPIFVSQALVDEVGIGADELGEAEPAPSHNPIAL